MAVLGPKRELTAFDVLVLAGELGELVGSYVEKVLQPSERELVVRLRKPGRGGMELVVRDGKWLFLREKEVSEGPPPPPFAMLLRKHLENRRLVYIGQKGFERIMVLGFDGYELVLELFGDGNVILLADGNIVQPLRNQSWEHREVRPGRPYVYPPPRVDPRALGPEEFSGLLASSRGDLVRTLAVSFNLGGRYAEEVCGRAGLDRDLKVGKMGQDKVRLIRSTVEDLFTEITQDKRPVLVTDKAVPVDFSPIPLRSGPGLEQRPFPTMNALVAHFIDYWREKQALDESSRQASVEIDRLKRQLENQQKAVEEYKRQAARSRRAAEAVSASLDGLAAILREVKTVKEAGGWEAVTRAIEQKRLPPAVREASPPEGGVKVRLTDAEGELEALLDLRKTARENISALFASYKDAVDKSKRTLELLDDVRANISKLESEGMASAKEAPRARRKKRLEWFERYRWFLSSDGNIVVAGKDAGSNDRVVKRHLKEGDAYAHADLHGAPSVIVKREKGDIPERTLREACQFALIYSKAWAAGLASGSAYWAKPDQVSKTPETGEYLPKGAFIVRGRKNFYHDMEMRLAIGWIERGDGKMLMGGPPSALATRTNEMLLLQPGDEDPKDLARKLCGKFGCETEEALRLLPPGRSKVLSH